MPAGVFNLVPAGREVGEQLIRHPQVDKVSFTGSTQAGRLIGIACAERLARVGLKLGGKSAAIVLEDADSAKVLPTLVPLLHADRRAGVLLVDAHAGAGTAPR